MPLSANLLRLESSILTRAKRATSRNNVATEKNKNEAKKNYFFIIFFFRGDFGRGDFIREPSKYSRQIVPIVASKIQRSVFPFFVHSNNIIIYTLDFRVQKCLHKYKRHQQLITNKRHIIMTMFEKNVFCLCRGKTFIQLQI